MTMVAMLVSVLPFLACLDAEFVWDDHRVQRALPDFTSVAETVRTKPDQVPWIFRPALIWIFMAEERVNNVWHGSLRGDAHRSDPRRARIPHLGSLLLHALATGVVTLLGLSLFGDGASASRGALFSGLAFGLHPIHAENVAWVSARADTVATLFLLGSLLLALSALRRGSYARLVLAGALFFLALLAKELALAGLALLPLTIWLAAPKPVGGRTIPRWAPLAISCLVAGLYFFLRESRGVSPGTSLFPPDPGLFCKQLAAAVGFYVRKILLPWPHTPFIPIFPGLFPTVAALGALGIATGLAVRSLQRGQKWCAYTLLWFLASVAPSLAVSLRSLTVAVLAERYLYLPSVALALALGAAVAKHLQPARSPIRTGAAAGLLLLAGVLSATAAETWRDDLTLMRTMTRQDVSRYHPLPWSGLGSSLLARGDLEAAESAFRTALAEGMLPYVWSRSSAWQGLGAIGVRKADAATNAGDLRQANLQIRAAEDAYARAAALSPAEWHIRKALGHAHLQRISIERALLGVTDESLLRQAGVELREAGRLSPENIEVRFAHQVYLDMGGAPDP